MSCLDKVVRLYWSLVAKAKTDPAYIEPMHRAWLLAHRIEERTSIIVK